MGFHQLRPESGRLTVKMVVNLTEQRQRRKIARQHVRKKLGKLANLMVQKKTLQRYENAAATFFAWTTRMYIDFMTIGCIARAAEQWISDCWEEGEPLSVAADTLSGLQ